MQVEDLKVTYPLKNLTKLGNFLILMFVMVIFSLAFTALHLYSCFYCGCMQGKKIWSVELLQFDDHAETNCCLGLRFMLLSFRENTVTAPKKRGGLKSSVRASTNMTILDSEKTWRFFQHLLHVTSVIFFPNVKRTTLPRRRSLLSFGFRLISIFCY